MATVKTIEVNPSSTSTSTWLNCKGCQTHHAITGLPPRPNHILPKFHNRSTLFPSSTIPKIQDDHKIENGNRRVLSADVRYRNTENKLTLPSSQDVTSHTTDRNYQSKNHIKQRISRRPCSAKARLENNKHHVSPNKKEGKSEISDICTDLVPVNGKEVPVVDIGDNAPFPTYHFMLNTKEKYVAEDTKPFLPGLINGRIPSTDVYQTPETNQTSKDPDIKPVVHGLNSHQVVFGTEFEEEVHNIKYDLTEPRHKKTAEKPLPSTLEPLRPWLTENTYVPGLGKSECLVFLPSLENYNDLPEVPPPHSINEDLPYKEKLQQPKTTTKKYHHPSFNKPHVQDWVCNHSRPGTANKTDNQNWNYQPSFRSIGEIRTEIQELENLMLGLGNIDSDCGMVKFQGEIDRFREMYTETMRMVPERLLYSPRDPDTFGVKEFLKQHVEIINEIRMKHTLCLEELRVIEAEAGIDSSRKYFKHRTPDT